VLSGSGSSTDPNRANPVQKRGSLPAQPCSNGQEARGDPGWIRYVMSTFPGSLDPLAKRTCFHGEPGGAAGEPGYRILCDPLEVGCPIAFTQAATCRSIPVMAVPTTTASAPCPRALAASLPLAMPPSQISATSAGN